MSAFTSNAVLKVMIDGVEYPGAMALRIDGVKYIGKSAVYVAGRTTGKARSIYECVRQIGAWSAQLYGNPWCGEEPDLESEVD